MIGCGPFAPVDLGQRDERLGIPNEGGSSCCTEDGADSRYDVEASARLSEANALPLSYAPSSRWCGTDSDLARSGDRFLRWCHHAPVLPDGASGNSENTYPIDPTGVGYCAWGCFRDFDRAEARRPSPSTLFELCRTRFAIIGRGCATRSLLAKRGGRTRDRTLDLSRVNHNP